jgi:hypothetical protein
MSTPDDEKNPEVEVRFPTEEPPASEEWENVTWHYSDRRIPFPWGLFIFMTLLVVLCALGIGWAGQRLGWWL